MSEEKIMTFDIESDNWIDLKLLGCYDGKEYRTFTSIPKFLNHILRDKYKGYRVYAHNGGKFDFLFLLEEIMERGLLKELTPRQGSVIIIKIGNKRTHITLADSYALLPDSLKRLSVAFDVPHAKGEIDFKGGEKFNPKSKKHLEYLYNDCVGLYEVLQKFFASEFVVKPKFTIASQALNTFKEKFCDFDLQRLDLQDENLIRTRFYSGGRVEVFKGEGKNIHSYDVNSLYPFAMLSEMPCGNYRTTTRYHDGKIGFYKVRIEKTPEWIVSPLLSKVQKGNSDFWQNYYVNGPGDYYLSSATLEMLKKDYGIRFKVEFGFVFSKREHLFNNYVNTFYKIKSENKGNALYYIAKYMLNSLYGKLGQMRWSETISFRSKGMEDFVSFDDYYGLVMTLRESRSQFILPYLACYITEIARLHHFKLMREVENDVFYCDTDSIFSTKKINSAFIGKDIGKLSYKGTFNGVFLAPKTYAIRNNKESQVVFKGFDPKEFTYRDFVNAAKKKLTLAEVKTRPMSFTECTRIEKARSEYRETPLKREKDIVHERGRYLKVVESKKRVVTIYDKRVVLPDKKHRFITLPFNYDEVN